MPNEPAEREEAKERIIKASVALFSEKGFDSTRVNEIADAADVNKALIYYYFKSKADILDYLLQTLFDDINRLALDFVNENVIRMIQDGRLDIEADRFHFIDDNAIALFLGHMKQYYVHLVDYVLERKSVFRILMLESLKKSGHQNDLFRFFTMAKPDSSNRLYKMISEADHDFTYPPELVALKFFFVLVPIVSFAAYFDEYKTLLGIGDEQLKNTFLSAIAMIMPAFISGTDLLLNNDLYGKLE